MSPNAREVGARLRAELASDELPRVFAQILSQHVRLRSGQEPLDSLRDSSLGRSLADAVRLIEAARIAKANDDPGWENGYRRAGELLEWLAHERINPEGLPLTLLGAAAYHLAGFPARSASLTAARPTNEADAPLLRALLEGSFSRLLPGGARVANARTRTVESRVEAGEERGQAWANVLADGVAGEVGAALGVLSAELRWGDTGRLKLALEKLVAAPPVLRRVADPLAWLLVRLCAEVAHGSAENDLRKALVPIGEMSTPEGRTVVERYVRLAFLANQTQVWPSQREGFSRLASDHSFALCTPTGSGKTRVAEVALLLGLFAATPPGKPAPLCLYIVPSRALAAEVERKLSRSLRGVSESRAVRVTQLYGGADWGPADGWLDGDHPSVLICTQEKAEALFRFFGWRLLGRLSTVIVDEAHAIQFDGSYSDLARFESRQLRLEALVGSLRSRRPEARYIAMSAVATDLERPMGQWISGDHDSTAVRVEYRSIRQLVGRLHTYSSGATRIVYDLLDGAPFDLAGAEDERPFVPHAFPERPPAPSFTKDGQNIGAFAFWAAAHLAASDGGDGEAQTVLVSVAQRPDWYAGWWLTLLDGDWKDRDLPTFFSEPEDEDDVALWNRALETCEDLFGQQSREYQLLRHGIVVHHGKMPGRLPGLLVRLVERRIVRIVLATSTLTEGVNLPVETVLVPSLHRYGSSGQTRLTAREFANLAGRAGRPGVSTEGQTLVLMPGSTTARSQIRTAYDGILRDLGSDGEERQLPRSALASLVEELERMWPGDDHEGFLQWLEQTAPTSSTGGVMPKAEQLLDSLDGIAIAAMEEVESGDEVVEVEAMLKSFWRQSFARHAADEEKRLERIFVARGKALATNIYPQRARRSAAFRANLPPSEAELIARLRPRLMAQLAAGVDYAAWPAEQRFEFVATAVATISEIPRFRLSDAPGNAEWTTILAWWLRAPNATATPTQTKIATWHDYLQKQLRYRFTWGLSAVVAAGLPDDADATLFDDWEATGSPWIVAWIKDLLVWGVLDPVAAALLARDVVVTRDAAEERARGYYETVENNGSADVLDAASVGAWVAAQVEGPSGESAEAEQRYDIDQLSPRMVGEHLVRIWRVIPSVTKRGIRWLDPSGVALAETSGLRLRFNARRYDFHLDPESRSVIASRYV